MTDGWLSLKILNLLASSLKRTPYFQRISLSVVATRLFFFLLLTFLPHKIGSFFVPHLTYIYTICSSKIFGYFFFWETCVVKVASLNIFLLLLETKRSIPICSPWVPFDLGSLYCLFRRTFAHFTKMCIKKQGKAWAERREREREESLISCLLCWYQYATLEISNFSPGGHHQVGLSIREKAPYYLCFSGHINFKKKEES